MIIFANMDFDKINWLVLDVDGVLTNNTLICTDDGQLWRTMHARDGYAMVQAIHYNIHICIITGGGSEGVVARLRKLGIGNIFDKVRDKEKVLQEFMLFHNIAKEEILYMGDDLPDLAAMQICGIRCCPADAVDEIRSIADYICKLEGGKGCVREVIEHILKAKKLWF